MDSAVAERSSTTPDRKASTSYPPMARQVMSKAATQGTMARRASLRRTDRFCRTFGIGVARSPGLITYMSCLVRVVSTLRRESRVIDAIGQGSESAADDQSRARDVVGVDCNTISIRGIPHELDHAAMVGK